MKIIEPYITIMSPIDGGVFLRAIETAGRVCYKSEDKITDESAPRFVRRLIENGHEAMLEHAPSISVKFVCDRGVSHEIVRHRLFSFAQESTRYCNYNKQKFGGELTFIKPCFFEEGGEAWRMWYAAMQNAEDSYLRLTADKLATPEQARTVLPNSLKTELVVTGNVREWRHFFKLRTAPEAHPQMREVARMALDGLKSLIPVVFADMD